MNDLQKTLQRIQEIRLIDMLARHPVVVVHGARQVGKTTLCLRPAIASGRLYKNLDDLNDLDTARHDPATFTEAGARMTIDEVQRCPELMLAIKAAVDRDRRPGRFLLTGSADLLVMERVAENLAGRAVYLPMPPLTLGEFEGEPPRGLIAALLDAPDAETALAIAKAAPKRPVPDLAAIVAAGGLPVPALSRDPETRSQWYDGYIMTYLERDVRNLSAVGSLPDFQRLMRAVALRTGQTLNVAALAKDVAMTTASARRYLGLLEQTFQLLRVPAYAVNRGKRLVKSPKIYWADTGLAVHLAGLGDAGSLPGEREWGALVETLVAIHLHALASLISPRPRLHHWRTSTGREVDLVIERGRALLPIEIKTGSRPSSRDAAGLKVFLDHYPNARLGILACRCDEPRRLTRRTLALPLETLLRG